MFTQVFSRCHWKAIFYFWVGILLCSPNNGMSRFNFPLSIVSVFDQFTSRLNLKTYSYFDFTNFILIFSKSKLRRSTIRVTFVHIKLFRHQAVLTIPSHSHTPGYTFYGARLGLIGLFWQFIEEISNLVKTTYFWTLIIFGVGGSRGSFIAHSTGNL